MSKQRPLEERLYFDPCYVAIVRAIRYEGCLGRELQDKLKPVIDAFGERRVESATWQLLTCDGQGIPGDKPPPLAKVQLRANVRKLAWGLLGPPPEHPWYQAFKHNERIPLPWETPEPKAEEPPAKSKRTRKAKK